MLEMGMASEIYIYLKKPKILLNSVSVKASRQTKTMFGLFCELCTVRSGDVFKTIYKNFPPLCLQTASRYTPLQHSADIPKQD
jgi:hypothetical protein